MILRPAPCLDLSGQQLALGAAQVFGWRTILRSGEVWIESPYWRAVAVPSSRAFAPDADLDQDHYLLYLMTDGFPEYEAPDGLRGFFLDALFHIGLARADPFPWIGYARGDYARAVVAGSALYAAFERREVLKRALVNKERRLRGLPPLKHMQHVTRGQPGLIF